MSMALFFTAVSKADYQAISSGEKHFEEVQQQSDTETTDLDYYSMDFIEYCYDEDGTCLEPIKALLSEAQDFDDISEDVMGATIYVSNARDKVIQAINDTNLEEFAKNFINHLDGKYDEEEIPYVVAKFNSIKAFFEKAKSENKLIIGSAG